MTDKAVFDKLSRKFEKHYMEDMAALGVKEPDVLTRVTEYVPQIVAYIKQIVAKGFAYESGGSVYLDITAFQQAGHDYRKLKPFKGETSAVDMVRPRLAHVDELCSRWLLTAWMDMHGRHAGMTTIVFFFLTVWNCLYDRKGGAGGASGAWMLMLVLVVVGVVVVVVCGV